MRAAVGAVLALSVVTATGACSSPGGDTNGLDVETYANPDDEYYAALYDGVLTGSVSDDLACFWLGAEPGDGAYVQWPEGHYALDDPLRILSSEGDVVGESGKRIELGGGEFPATGECGGLSYDRVWFATP